MKAILLLLLTACVALADDTEHAQLVTREYFVSSRLLKWLESVDPLMPAPPPAKDFLTSSGVTFPAEATAVYISSTQKLIIRNTPAFHRLYQQLLNQAKKPNGTKNPPDPKLLQAIRDASYKS